jgi:hypothetical protein
MARAVAAHEVVGEALEVVADHRERDTALEAEQQTVVEVGRRRRHVDVEGFPVCHIDDIIASKAATGRAKDRESLPRLQAFRLYLREQGRA